MPKCVKEPVNRGRGVCPGGHLSGGGAFVRTPTLLAIGQLDDADDEQHSKIRFAP